MAPLDPRCDWLRLDLLDAEPKVSRASSESSTPSARGETRFGDYKILGTLGSGGMGVVYRARQHGIDREVAIKSLSQVALIDSTARARFESELKILGKLRHANIVQVHESGLDQGVPFLVMEYVPGGTLKDLIQERSSNQRVAELIVEVARAVDWAHGQGIIHRDLKPSNIFLTEAGQPKVADFGIALEIEDTQKFTRTGELVGTPVYMPPERLNGTQLLKPSSDVYALGVVLHELLTGVVPFAGESLSAVLVQVMSRDPLPLQTWTPNLPRDLDTICRKCLNKDSARRYQTAAEFADDLQRFLDNRPIAARPVGYWEKTSRWCRRQPLAAALAGGLASVVFIAVVGLTVGLLLMSDMNADLKQSNVDLDESRQAEEEQKQRAEKTLNFMVDAFRRPDPGVDGKALTAFDVMKKASEKLGADATLDAPTRRSLLQAIGLAFIGLGEYHEAREVLERADKVIKSHLDSDDIHSLKTRHDLALAYRLDGKYASALELYERVRDRQVELLGPEDPDSLMTSNNLAAVYRILGRKAEAIELYERVLKKRVIRQRLWVI